MSTIAVDLSFSLNTPVPIHVKISFKLPNQPNLGPMSVVGPSRRISPTLYPTPPQTAINSLPDHLRPSKQNATSHFDAGQHVLPNNQRVGEENTAKKESRLLERKAQLVADQQLRALPCPWRQGSCDAVLGSVELLQRHVEKHMHMHDADDIQCHWERCIHGDFASVDGLRQHVKLVHTPRLTLYDTITPSERTAKPFLPPTLPTLTELPQGLPAWALTNRAVQPSIPAPKPIRVVRDLPRTRNRLSPSSSSSSSRGEQVHPIMPQRDPDDYWPLNGEADIHHGHSYWPSSSIFPRIRPIDRTDLATKWHTLQTKGIWEKGYAMEIRKRSPIVPIFQGADLAYRRHKAEVKEERAETYKRVKAMGDRKGKGKAVDDGLQVDEGAGAEEGIAVGVKRERYPVERITRASAKRARRITGRSIGIAAIEEMIAFEQAGIDFGELPDDYSLAK